VDARCVARSRDITSREKARGARVRRRGVRICARHEQFLRDTPRRDARARLCTFTTNGKPRNELAAPRSLLRACRCASPISYLAFRVRIECLLISSRAASCQLENFVSAPKFGKRNSWNRNGSSRANRVIASWARDSRNFFACHLLPTRVPLLENFVFGSEVETTNWRETWERDNLRDLRVPQITIFGIFVRVPAPRDSCFPLTKLRSRTKNRTDIS